MGRLGTEGAPPIDASDVTLTDAQGRKRQLDRQLGGSIEDVVAFEASRLVFLLNGNGLAVIDPNAAKVVDEFYAVNTAFSPTHRFIAFTAIVPRWAEASELYLVYDLALSPERNCMATDCSGLSDGIAVYPHKNRRDHSYDVTLYDATHDDAARPTDKVIAAMHELKSELTWIDESRFVFLDCSRNACQVVTADVRDGGAKAAVVAHALNVQALVDVKGVPTQMPIYPAQWIRAEWIGRQDVGGKTGIRVWLKWDAWMKAEYVDVGLGFPER
jgi:hypothetical protein